MVRRLRPMLTAILVDGPRAGQEMLLDALKPVILVHEAGRDEPLFYQFMGLASDGKSASYQHIASE